MFWTHSRSIKGKDRVQKKAYNTSNHSPVDGKWRARSVEGGPMGERKSSPKPMHLVLYLAGSPCIMSPIPLSLHFSPGVLGSLKNAASDFVARVRR